MSPDEEEMHEINDATDISAIVIGINCSISEYLVLHCSYILSVAVSFYLLYNFVEMTKDPTSNREYCISLHCREIT